MYKKFLDSSNCSLYTQYKKYRNTLNRALECAKRNYYSKILIQNKHNIGKVYEKINEICKLKSKKRVLPNKIVDETGSHIEDPQYIAESFNDYFARIGYKMAESISEPPQKLPISQLHTYSANSFFMFPSSTDEVAQLIENLNDKKTVRSNDVETRFIKYSKSIISPIISDLFNLCVNKGVFPNCLKIAEIIPIYKKSDINKATNYRPIALLSQFNKLMEKMIFSRLYSYLEKKQLLNDNQYGFRPNSSTAFAISSLYDKLIKNIDNGLFSCCVFLDFSKAFDTVDHKILLWKLHNYFGIRGTRLNLFESYLSNRYQ